MRGQSIILKEWRSQASENRVRKERGTDQKGKLADLKMEGGKRGQDMRMLGVMRGQGTTEGMRGQGSATLGTKEMKESHGVETGRGNGIGVLGGKEVGGGVDLRDVVEVVLTEVEGVVLTEGEEVAEEVEEDLTEDEVAEEALIGGGEAEVGVDEEGVGVVEVILVRTGFARVASAIGLGTGSASSVKPRNLRLVKMPTWHHFGKTVFNLVQGTKRNLL